MVLHHCFKRRSYTYLVLGLQQFSTAYSLLDLCEIVHNNFNFFAISSCSFCNKGRHIPNCSFLTTLLHSVTKGTYHSFCKCCITVVQIH